MQNVHQVEIDLGILADMTGYTVICDISMPYGQSLGSSVAYVSAHNNDFKLL